MKGIYIHIPFCVQKCRYCDFVSYSGKTEYTDAYLDALFGEMQNYKGESADTVFIGGGTPTILSAVQLEKLIRKCFENFDISKEYEFSIEANPGTLDDEKAKTLLKKEYEKAMDLLKNNKQKLHELAKYLYEKETITGDEFMQILNAQEPTQE